MSRKYLAVAHWLVALSMSVALLNGCTSILPQPPIQVLLPPYTNYEGVMAMEIAYTCPVTSDTVPDTKPSTLKEGDKCPHCVNGKLTKDGVPTDDCWHCLGDGICNKNDPVLASPGELVLTIFGEMVDGINAQLKQVPGKKCSCENCTCINCDKDNCTCEECPKACLPIPSKKVEEVIIDASPKDLLPRKQFKDVVQYHMSWNMRHYTWSDDRNCFVDNLGHTVTFSSIPGFHPMKYKNVQMGCTTGRCTLVPITKSVSQVEVTDDQPRATQRPANGEGK